MKRKDLVKWLELKRTIALQEEQRRYDQDLAKYKEEFISSLGLLEDAKVISEHLEDLNSAYKELIRKVTNISGISLSLYPQRRSVNSVLYMFDSEQSRSPEKVLDSILTSDIVDQSSEAQRLKFEHVVICSDIRKNYHNVIENVRALPNLKSAINYLIQIGFSEEEIKELAKICRKPVPETLAPVDSNILFFRCEEEKCNG